MKFTEEAYDVFSVNGYYDEREDFTEGVSGSTWEVHDIHREIMHKMGDYASEGCRDGTLKYWHPFLFFPIQKHPYFHEDAFLQFIDEAIEKTKTYTGKYGQFEPVPDELSKKSIYHACTYKHFKQNIAGLSFPDFCRQMRLDDDADKRRKASIIYEDLGFPFSSSPQEYARYIIKKDRIIVCKIMEIIKKKPRDSFGCDSIALRGFLGIRLASIFERYLYRSVKKYVFGSGHSYIVGRTGSGKSELIKAMSSSMAEDGGKVVILDPHGDLADDSRALFEKSKIVDFSRSRFTINPFDLKDRSPANRALVAQEITALTGELMEDAELSRQMEAVMYPVIYTMLALPYADFSMLRDLMHPSEGAEKLEALAGLAEPHHKTIFKDLMGDIYDTTKRSVFSRLQSLLNHKSLLLTLCGKDDFKKTIKKMMGTQKSGDPQEERFGDVSALIFSLPIPRLGDVVSQTIGRILMTSFQIWARGRESIPPSERNTLFLFVDEFQNFLSQATAQTLDQFGRKFGLSLVLAHQHIKQIRSAEIRGSVLANTKFKIVGMSDHDTRATLAREMGLSAEDMEVSTGNFFMREGNYDAFEFYCMPVSRRKKKVQAQCLTIESKNAGDRLPECWEWMDAYRATKHTSNASTGTRQSASEEASKKTYKPKFDL